jgi:hypothetical protein
MAWTTPRSWVAGEVVTAALLNTHLRDNLTATPRGVLGYAEVTASQGTFGAETDITGLSVTITAGTARRIKVTAQAGVNTNGGAVDDVAGLNVKEGATLLTYQRVGRVGATTLGIGAQVILTPTAGSHTYKVSMVREAGSGGLTMVAGTVAPAFILVEDLGPA